MKLREKKNKGKLRLYCWDLQQKLSYWGQLSNWEQLVIIRDQRSLTIQRAVDNFLKALQSIFVNLKNNT